MVGRSERSWHAFCARVEALGGVVQETAWLGCAKPHRIVCSAGHNTTARPTNVQQGSGICRICVGHDPRTADAAFRANVANAGGTVLEPVWLGNGVPHRLRCAAGHETATRPVMVTRGQGICRFCAGFTPQASFTPEEAWESFKLRVEELGGRLLETDWLGATVRHRVVCRAGHTAMTLPTLVQQGGGLCRQCAGKDWDSFYVVTDDLQGHLKFGVTSHGARRRLREHANDGFTTVVRLLADFPQAFALEGSVKATLRLAGEKPVRGREYFHARVLATVLDVVDHYPGTTVPAPRKPQAASHSASRGEHPEQSVSVSG